MDPRKARKWIRDNNPAAFDYSRWDELVEDVMDVEQLEAGREMDALVAERVMGLPGVGYYKRKSVREGGYIPAVKGEVTADYPDWKAKLYYLPGADEHSLEEASLLGIRPRAIPRYSTDIDAALSAAETRKSYTVHKDILHGETVYRADFPHDDVWDVVADTLPLAICRALLAADDAGPGE